MFVIDYLTSKMISDVSQLSKIFRFGFLRSWETVLCEDKRKLSFHIFFNNLIYFWFLGLFREENCFFGIANFAMTTGFFGINWVRQQAKVFFKLSSYPIEPELVRLKELFCHSFDSSPLPFKMTQLLKKYHILSFGNFWKTGITLLNSAVYSAFLMLLE